MGSLVPILQLIGVILFFAFFLPVCGKIWRARGYIAAFPKITERRKILEKRWEELAKSGGIKKKDVLIKSMAYDGAHMFVLLNGSREFLYVTEDGHSVIDYTKVAALPPESLLGCEPNLSG